MDWKNEIIKLTILYRIAEKNEEIPVITDGTDYSFIDGDLNDMVSDGLLEIDTESGTFSVSSQGREACKSLLAVYDHVAKFEIFSNVNVAMQPEEDECDEEGQMLHQMYDPRFQGVGDVDADELGAEDMRLAMIQFLSEEMSEEPGVQTLNPYRVVFVQKLAQGMLNKKDIWFDFQLGSVYKDIEEIVESAYQWTDVDEDEETSRAVMQSIYTAGMVEQRKRDGLECSNCGIPLAMFDFDAKENDETLEKCPNPECGASFSPPPPDYECPACGGGVTKGQAVCSCGATLDFSMPPGTITTETTEVTEYDEEPIWRDTYGYTGYIYYDPYDPFVDAFAFGAVCIALW